MCFFPSSFHISVLALTGRHSSLGPSGPELLSLSLFAFRHSPIESYGTCSLRLIPIYINNAITVSTTVSLTQFVLELLDIFTSFFHVLLKPCNVNGIVHHSVQLCLYFSYLSIHIFDQHKLL